MAETALGHDVRRFNYRELAGGLCNAVWLVDTEAAPMVLKVASAPGVVTMRHERDYVATEARLLSYIQPRLRLQAPEVVFFDESLTICPVPYFFMTKLEGQSLTTVNPKPDDGQIGAIKRRIGEITRDMCSLRAERFGIPALPATHTASNAEFVLTLFRLLLDDATDKGVAIPGIESDALLDLVSRQRQALDEAKSPCYAHTDTWDGNILVKDGQFTGLVDFAAILWADPLMSHDFHDFSPVPRPEFLAGYGQTEFTEAEWTRIAVYKVWQRLGMIMEIAFRGYADANLYSWVHGEFVKEVENLKKR